MSSKTKIVVLHMKEIIYTTIFIVLGILLLLLLFFMFLPEKKEGSPGAKQYQPGIYTSTLTLNNTDLEVGSRRRRLPHQFYPFLKSR